ncbi:MAG: L-lactate dehydrogenase complex protein LldG [Flavobacterium sp.]|jgi:L-lactate dehydrogenase complex protein LldG
MSRAKLLNKLRAQLNVSSEDLTRRQAVESRLSQHLPNTIPKRCLQPHEALVDLFQSKIEAANATVNRIGNSESIVDAISDYLGSGHHDLCVKISHGFSGLDFSNNTDLQIKSWSPKMSLNVCVSDCFGAVAETGSLVVSSSNTMPLSFNFLGDAHIVLLRAELIVGAYEDIWNKVRESIPRDITLVSGPSCTGDIEMIMELGAHGPKNLHIIIIGCD